MTVPSSRCCATSVHDWAAVEPWVRYEALFADDLHAGGVPRARSPTPTCTRRSTAADPDVADLLARLAAEEVEAEPVDAVVRLLTRDAARARGRRAHARVAIGRRPDSRCSRCSTGSR